MRRRWPKAAGDLVAVSWSDDAICELVYHAGSRLRRVALSGGKLLRSWERKLASSPGPGEWLRADRLFLCVSGATIDAFSIDSGEPYWHLLRPSTIRAPLRLCAAGVLVEDDDGGWCLVQIRNGKRIDSGRVGDAGYGRLITADAQPRADMDGLLPNGDGERATWIDARGTVRIVIDPDGAVEVCGAGGELQLAGRL